MRAEADSIGAWCRGVPLSATWPILAGIGILVVWLGCFGVWAGVAPLNSAVVASGTFVATGQNKQVQHFEGGIIREIAVKEGDVVEANQVLVRMDDTAANAKLRRLVLKKYRLLAMKARLEAEMRSSETIGAFVIRTSKRFFSGNAPSSGLARPALRPKRACSGSKSRDWKKVFADMKRKCSPPGIALRCLRKS
jgi:hypothetical protein